MGSLTSTAKDRYTRFSWSDPRLNLPYPIPSVADPRYVASLVLDRIFRTVDISRVPTRRRPFYPFTSRYPIHFTCWGRFLISNSSDGRRGKSSSLSPSRESQSGGPPGPGRKAFHRWLGNSKPGFQPFRNLNLTFAFYLPLWYSAPLYPPFENPTPPVGTEGENVALKFRLPLRSPRPSDITYRKGINKR